MGVAAWHSLRCSTKWALHSYFSLWMYGRNSNYCVCSDFDLYWKSCCWVKASSFLNRFELKVWRAHVWFQTKNSLYWVPEQRKPSQPSFQLTTIWMEQDIKPEICSRWKLHGHDVPRINIPRCRLWFCFRKESSSLAFSLPKLTKLMPDKI